MNIAVLHKYGLEMRKTPQPFNGYVKGFLSSYLIVFRHPDDVQDFIDNVDLAINGNFNEVEDPDFSEGLVMDPRTRWIAYLTPVNFEIRHYNQSYEDRLIIPLADWKEILMSWKECLEV